MNFTSTLSGHSGKMCFRYLLIGVSYQLRGVEVGERGFIVCAAPQHAQRTAMRVRFPLTGLSGLYR